MEFEGLTLAPDAAHRGDGADAAAGATRLSEIAAARSATLRPLLEMDADGRAELPADAATIAAVAEWMERPADDSVAADSFGAVAVLRALRDQLRASNAACVAAALELAEHLQLEPLVAALLDMLGADGGVGILRACMASVRALPWMVAAKLEQDDETTQALLEAVLVCDDATTDDEKSAALDWMQLQLCDRLGLVAWVRAERGRRQALTQAAMAANQVAREIVGLLTVEETTELTELAAEEAEMPPKPTKKIWRREYGYSQDDVYDEASDPLAERRKAVAARRKELEEKSPAARGALDGELADAVQAGDLAAAKEAFAKGAALNLYWVGGLDFSRSWWDASEPPDVSWMTADALPEDLDGTGTADASDAQPLICSVADNIPMVNWMLDNGADVNACQPDGIVMADGYGYGGANVLVSASTLKAVELLCARGADAGCTWIPPQYDQGGPPERGLVAANTPDGPIARCLVRHGADVNAITLDHWLEFGSYWQTVVKSGDVAWAAELLAKYGANADWPSQSNIRRRQNFHDEHYEEGDRGDDFSTVLIIAVRKQDLPMVRLLLEHGADANMAKPKIAGDHKNNQDKKPGELPLAVALETGNAPIIELLKSKGAKAAAAE